MLLALLTAVPGREFGPGGGASPGVDEAGGGVPEPLRGTDPRREGGEAKVGRPDPEAGVPVLLEGPEGGAIIAFGRLEWEGGPDPGPLL